MVHAPLAMPPKVTCDSHTPLLIAAAENLHGHISFLPRSIPGMTAIDRDDLLLVDSGLPSDTFA